MVAPAPMPGGPSVWALELGEAVRGAEFRRAAYSARGHHLLAWRSRRESVRTRRRFVEALLAGKSSAEAVEEVSDEQLELDFVPVRVSPALPPVIVEPEDAAPDAVPEAPVAASVLPPWEPSRTAPVEVLVAEQDELSEDNLGPALRARIAAYTIGAGSALADDAALLDGH